QGNRIEANVFPQVMVGGREFDSLGSHYTILGIVDEPYTWSKQLRGRSGVVFRITVFAAAKKLVLRYRMSGRLPSRASASSGRSRASRRSSRPSRRRRSRTLRACP